MTKKKRKITSKHSKKGNIYTIKKYSQKKQKNNTYTVDINITQMMVGKQ